MDDAGKRELRRMQERLAELDAAIAAAPGWGAALGAMDEEARALRRTLGRADWVTRAAREQVDAARACDDAERSNNSAWRLRKARRWFASLLGRQG